MTKILHIAILTPKMIIGGAEIYTIAKARYLSDRGHKVIVVSAGGENVQNLPDGVTHYTMPEFDRAPFELNGKQRKQSIEKLTSILICEKIDVVEAHNTYPIYYGTLAAKKAGAGCLYNLLNELSHKKQMITNVIIKEFSQKGCYFTFTVNTNKYVEQELGLKLNPIIIPLPVENTQDNDRPQDGNYILTVCRFSPDKMYVLWLIDGFAAAVQSKLLPINITLKIVGNGSLHKEVEQRVAKANAICLYAAVELLGFKQGNELECLYNNCTIYAGMGTTILQAAQRGKAIINVGLELPFSQYTWGYWGQNPERDAHSLVYKPQHSNISETPVSYADALSVATNKDKLRSLGSQAKELFETHYEFSKIMKEWEVQYELVASKRCRLSRKVENRLKIRIFVLHYMWKAFQVLKQFK